MADWKALIESDDDFFSKYTSKTGTPHGLKDDTSSELFPPSPCQLDGSSAFCTETNMQTCLSYINQELQIIGFSSFHENGSGKVDLVQLINRLYDVLCLYHRSQRVKEELENRLHRVSGERNHYQSANTRIKQQYEELDREVAQEQEKCRQLVNKNKTIMLKHKSDKEEVKRLQSVILHRDLQSKHEVKKYERDLNRLKERLHQLLTDKSPARKIGIDMVNGLYRSEGRRATWKTCNNKQEEEMYQLIMQNYEERQQELMVENSDLRNCLANMQKELTSLLQRSELSASFSPPSNNNSPVKTSLSAGDNGEDDKSTDISSCMAIEDLELSDGYFQMPYDIIHGDIERNLKGLCQKIENSIRKTAMTPSAFISLDSGVCNSQKTTPSQSSNPTPGRSTLARSTQDNRRRLNDVDRLQKRVDKYKEIIKQQEELIQQSIQSQSKSVENTFLHESHLLQEKEALSEQKKLFYQEKANFEDERKKFTEEAIKLGRERQAVQEEKTALLQKQFFSITPFKDKNTPKKDGTPGTRLLPATPVFSPAPGGTPGTPSTAELFRTLGLMPKEKKPTPLSKAASAESIQTAVSKRSFTSSHSSPASFPHLSANQLDAIKIALFHHKANSTANDELQ